MTFFFSGGREETFEGEDRILIDSPKVATYDLKPEMSAYEVTDALVKEIEAEKYDTIILNFANPDMVGHSGMLEPTKKAIEAVDECLGKVVSALLEKGGTALITADHGNADEVVTVEGNPMTAHTVNPVPLIVTKKGVQLREGGILGDLIPIGVEQMRRRIRALAQKPILVLDFSAVTKVDETGALALQDFVHRLQREGKSVYLGGLQREPLRMLIRMGVVDSLGRRRVCKHLNSAMRRATQDLAPDRRAE